MKRLMIFTHNGFWKFISHHSNNNKHIHEHCVKGACWFSMISYWCKKLHVCVILVAKDEHKFLIIILLMRHILGIPSNQIKTKWKFFVVGILTTLYKCHLQTIFFHKLAFVNKNWPSNPWTVWNLLTLHCYARWNQTW